VIGALDGSGVGSGVGRRVGLGVGSLVGVLVSPFRVGDSVTGRCVGSGVGCLVGLGVVTTGDLVSPRRVGFQVGRWKGLMVGCAEGVRVSPFLVGDNVTGRPVGSGVGGDSGGRPCGPSPRT